MLTLHDHFELLRAEQPQLTAGREPLGGGAFGLVMSGPDDTVIKVLWKRGDNHPEQSWTQRMFKQEIAFFKAMDNIPVKGIEIPRLVREPTPLTGDNFAAAYSMTRLAGAPENWAEVPKEMMPAYHRRLGGALSRLHQAFARIDPALRREFQNYGPTRIEAVEGLDDALNQRLEKADRYFQAHKVPGFIHGDFHGGNVMITPPHKPIGILDLSFASYTDNCLIDTARVVQISSEGSGTFIEGYAAENGEEADPLMAHLTALSHSTQSARFFGVGHEWHDGLVEQVKKTLEQSSQIRKSRNQQAPALQI